MQRVQLLRGEVLGAPGLGVSWNLLEIAPLRGAQGGLAFAFLLVDTGASVHVLDSLL